MRTQARLQNRMREALRATDPHPVGGYLPNRWLTVALLLAALVLAGRLIGLAVTMDDVLVNPPLVKAAMRVVVGAPAAAVDATASPAAVSGVQARALAQIAQATGQRASVELWLRRGLEDAQSAYLAQFELCRLYWEEGRRERATEACRATKASAAYWLEHGYVADQRGDRGEALAYFQMAAAVDPDLVAAWQQAGHALFAFERYDEAIQAYERVLALDSSPTADVVHALGQAYLSVGNPTLARDVLDRGLLIYPNQRELFLVMAETYRQEADLATADGWYGRILQRWPDDARTWANRADVAVAEGRWGDALAYLQEATANQPEDVGYWLALADAATQAENVAVATDAYERVMALRPDDPGVWLQAGRFLAQTDQAGPARAVLAHVLVLEADNDEAATLLATLDDPTGQGQGSQ